MADDVFMSIIPRDPTIIGGVSDSIKLRVIRGDVELNPDIKFNKVDLNTGEKFYHNNSSPYHSFNITVLIHEDDRIGTLTVNDALDYFIRHGIPFYVNTKAVAVRTNALYLVTDNDSRKQSDKSGYVYWSLTFTRYSDVNKITFKNTNKVVKKALKMYARSKMTPQEKLRLCDRKQLVYSYEKKKVLCVKYLQQILYQQGFLKGKYSEVVDQWYSRRTKNAVKAYQQKYAKDGLPATGNMNLLTYNHMCGITAQIGKTIELPNDLPRADSNGVIDTRTNTNLPANDIYDANQI